MKKRVLLSFLLSLGLAACGDDSGGGDNQNVGNQNNNNQPSECSLTDGDNYDYIITKLVVPTNNTEAKLIGVDLDGDQVIDNRLGQIIGTIAGNQTDVNQSIQDGIDNGSFILLGRLVVNNWDGDRTVAAQIFPGSTDSGDATEDNLTGNGCAVISPNADRDLKLCGSITANYLRAGPSDLQVGFTFGGQNLTVTLERAKAEGEVTETTWTDVQVGGGISKEAIDNELLPMLVDWLNDAVKEDPTGGVADFVFSSVDGKCSTDVEGCESVTPGSGDCAEWDENPANDVVTITELKCNPTLASVLQPDVDFDGDGVEDHLSLGLKLSAVKVTIADSAAECQQ